MPPKEKRKGRREIHKGNMETLEFYQKFIVVGTATQVLHILLFFYLGNEFSSFNYLFLVLAVALQLGCYYSLQKLAKPELGPRGELIEAGLDLSDTYFSEYAIDCIILTTGVQMLSAISNYMWLLWLAGPFYLIYKGWTSVIWPWIKSGSGGGDSQEKTKRHKHKPKFRGVQ